VDLSDALTQIADIRQQMARTLVFRGYRSATTAFSGLVAIAAAAFQAYAIPQPYRAVDDYLMLWLLAALVSVTAVVIEIILRCRRTDQPLQWELSLAAVDQFLPCLVAGALLTYVIVAFCGEQVWMLPGLWMILFSMGVFASRRLLPKPVVLIAMYYLLAGLMVLAMRRDAGLSPWTMGAVFGFGQFFAAGVLYWTLERSRE
jgi:hypothetical protein